MYICICSAMSENELKGAIKQYGSCPATISVKTGAGLGCGQCKALIEQHCNENTCQSFAGQVKCA